jgi:hypothetical protein
MRIEYASHWCHGKAIPDKFQGKGPFDLTIEDLEQLYTEYDVMITHLFTRREYGAPKVFTGSIGLFLDELGGKFRVR